MQYIFNYFILFYSKNIYYTLYSHLLQSQALVKTASWNCRDGIVACCMRLANMILVVSGSRLSNVNGQVLRVRGALTQNIEVANCILTL